MYVGGGAVLLEGLELGEHASEELLALLRLPHQLLVLEEVNGPVKAAWKSPKPFKARLNPNGSKGLWISRLTRKVWEEVGSLASPMRGGANRPLSSSSWAVGRGVSRSGGMEGGDTHDGDGRTGQGREGLGGVPPAVPLHLDHGLPGGP